MFYLVVALDFNNLKAVDNFARLVQINNVFLTSIKKYLQL